jgi:hypothetical protein
MEEVLKGVAGTVDSLGAALNAAIDAWSVGHLTGGGDETAQEMPSGDTIGRHRQEQLALRGIEAAILERHGRAPIRYRSLSDEEVRTAIGA